MIQPADLPETLAVFPLPGALLLPQAKLPLHLFEPRYLQMFEDCLKTPHRMIGMVQPRENPNGRGDIAARMGCAGRVTQMSETEDGRYFITLTGVARFTIITEVEGFTPYRRCDVHWVQGDNVHSDCAVPGFDRAPLMGLLERFFEVRGLSTDWDAMTEATDEVLINSLAMHLDFPPEDKQALLEATDISGRHETLITLLEFALRSGTPEEKMQ